MIRVSKKKILLVTRHDAIKKPGGDVSLMKSFMSELAGGYFVEMVSGVPSESKIEEFDLVFCCNLDRPIEPFETFRLCEKLGKIFVLYTLHHPYLGVRSYLEKGVFGSRKLIAFFSRYDPALYESMLWQVRVFLGLIFGWKVLPFGSVKNAQRILIGPASKVVVSSKKEVSAIRVDIGVVQDYYICKHSLDLMKGRWQPDVNKIVVPGRIESRKNQNFVFKVADNFPDLYFVFVGDMNGTERGYVKEFEKRIGERKNCSYISGLHKSDFYDLLCSAQVVLTASWFEVTSLIELYCIYVGIPLVCSRYSYNPNAPRVFEFDPSEPKQALIELSKALKIHSSDKFSPAIDGDDDSILHVVDQIFLSND